MAVSNIQLIEKVEIYARLNRRWRQVLSPVEFSVLSYLVDASIGHGRLQNDFTIEQMINGAWKANGDTRPWLTPVNVSRTSLVDALNKLREMGAISWNATKGRQKRTILLNVNWRPEVKFNVPKRKQNLHPGSKNNESDVQFVPPHDTKKGSLCAATRQHRQRVDSDGEFKPCVRASLDAPIEVNGVEKVDNAEKVVKDIQSRPKRKLSAEYKKQHRRKWLTAVWRESWAEGRYKDLPPALSPKMQGQLGRAIDRFPDKGEAIARWAFTNWRKLMSEEFKWLSPRPETPDPGILLTHIMRFADAYAISERRLNYDFTEESEVARLVATGMSESEAWKEIGKRQMRREGSEKLDKERARLALESKALETGRKNLLRDKQELARKHVKTPEEIIRDFDASLPLIHPQTRDYWSEENLSMPESFGEWTDDDNQS